LDDVAVLVFPFEDIEGERIKQMMLNRAFERAGTVDGVVALVADVFFGGFGEGEGEALFGEAFADAVELEIDDGGEVGAVDAVEEFRAEVIAQGLGDEGLALLGVGFVEDVLGADVGRHDEHGVAEIARAALAVGDAAVVEHLEQGVLPERRRIAVAMGAFPRHKKLVRMPFTDHQAKYLAHELTRRWSSDSVGKFAAAVAGAQVDLNPHQVDAALFAFNSPFSNGALLADEVGLGKTIEAGILLSQRWAERKRRILIITPSNLRKQWHQELAEKFFLPATILEARSYN